MKKEVSGNCSVVKLLVKKSNCFNQSLRWRHFTNKTSVFCLHWQTNNGFVHEILSVMPELITGTT